MTVFILFASATAIISINLGIKERVVVIVLFGLIRVALSKRYHKKRSKEGGAGGSDRPTLSYFIQYLYFLFQVIYITLNYLNLFSG